MTDLSRVDKEGVDGYLVSIQCIPLNQLSIMGLTRGMTSVPEHLPDRQA